MARRLGYQNKEEIMNSSCGIDVTTRCLKPTITIIGGAALVDSINPCAIAVLLILLTSLLTQKNKKKILSMGIIFISSIYIAYFLLGVGLLGVINISGLANLFHKIIGVLAILIGLLNVKDFFKYGAGGFVMEIPRIWRPKLKSLITGATSPLGIFSIGFVVTLFELPCTGGPYIFVLGLLSQGYNWKTILPMLLFYNLVFVIPLVIILFLIYFGFSTIDKTNEWKDRNIRILHLIAGIIMLILGVWVFLN